MKFSKLAIGVVPLTLGLAGCELLEEKTPEESAEPIVVEAPLPEAREAITDEDGNILTTPENMWRNRDENSDSRS